MIKYLNIYRYIYALLEKITTSHRHNFYSYMPLILIFEHLLGYTMDKLKYIMQIMRTDIFYFTNIFGLLHNFRYILINIQITAYRGLRDISNIIVSS